jgi:hypothetical protein
MKKMGIERTIGFSAMLICVTEGVKFTFAVLLRKFAA